MGNQSPEEKREYNRRRWERWNAANPGVASKRMAQWKKDNPERLKVLAKKARLKKIGLTPEQFDELLTSQGNRCKLCRKERLPHEREWQVDHCHDSKIIRGILCYNCNVGLGHFKDDEKLLVAAIEYLRSSRGLAFSGNAKKHLEGSNGGKKRPIKPPHAQPSESDGQGLQ